MMKQILIPILLSLLVSPAVMAADELQPAELDSLLAVYEKARGAQRTELARQLTASCLADDPLADVRRPDIGVATPRDTTDLLVWYAAERYYVSHSYFAEAIAIIDKALPLASSHDAEMQANLFCDRGYCLYKMSRHTEAVDAEMAAEKTARRHKLWLPLARAYNYMAIINLSLGYIDEAKHFVAKALETDLLTGSRQNTHNYLGIACEVYNIANVPDSAIAFGHQAVEAAREIGYDAGVVNHLSQLSYAYNRKGDFEKAISLAHEAVSTVEQMDVVDRNLLAISLEYLTYSLLDSKRGSEAVPFIRRAISLQEELGNTRAVCYDHRELALSLEAEQPHEAFKALRRYSQMMDSIHYAQMHDVLGKANAELHNDELAEANAAGQRRQTVILAVAVGVALLLLGVILLLGYASRLRGRTNDALRQLQTTRERFFTNVTHEFRTPLTVIMGLSKQMQEPHPATDSRQAAAMIEQQGARLLELVNQLLDLSKLQSAPTLPPMVCRDVVGPITMIVESFTELAERKYITLTYEPAEPAAVMDHVPDYLYKIVTNLLSNALKFTDDGGSVRVATAVEGDRFRLVVSDTGCGIPAEQQPHIFDPFYQVEDTAQRHPGTGLGLALVRQLADAVGADIHVDSTPGEGTTFTVSFPRRCSQQADTLSAESSQAMAPATLADAEIAPQLIDADTTDDNRTRVLVVEDHVAVAYYIGSILSANYDVFYAADGKAGLKKAHQIVPDVVVTDLMMPRMDGLEFCRRLREDELTSHVPVVVITAKAAEADRLEGLQAGADAYLTKPFNAQELLIRVEKLLEQRRLLREKFSQQMAQHVAAIVERTGETADNAPVAPMADAGKPTIDVPTRLDQLFLEKVDALILKLMPKGEADLEHVADQLFMHPPTFRRKIMALTGTPPAQYIMRFRLEQACKMLYDYPNVTMAEVAERCGFADGAHFSHAFRRYYNTTPLQWAKKMKDGL